jgi:2-keto-4-pentenoate hydratase/2-oxohepta-3-ene-1,7-dioic acid hydratase in catechol pathway
LFNAAPAMSEFSICTIRLSGAVLPAIEIGGRYWRLTDSVFGGGAGLEARGLMALFDDWAASDRRLNQLAAELPADRKFPALDMAGAEFQTPLMFPAKVVCTGLNYYNHLAEAGRTDFKKEDHFPPLFFKPPTTTLVGSGKSVRYPAQTEKLDWEIELAVVIGRRCRHVSVSDAMDVVAGYSIAADLSARDRQFDPRHFGKSDAVGGKAFDDSCPMGPGIVPSSVLRDPTALNIELRVNGAVEQQANTKDMIWSIAEQIHEVTRHMTFEPGDVLLTGTPAGVGLYKDRYLKVGDKLQLTIERLGELQFEIAEGPPSGAAPLAT